jgi:hypothetical protein
MPTSKSVKPGKLVFFADNLTELCLIKSQLHKNARFASLQVFYNLGDRLFVYKPGGKDFRLRDSDLLQPIIEIFQ